MKRLALTLTIAVAACALWAPVSAQAAFSLEEFDVSFSKENGSPATQAGSHPFAMTTKLALNTKPGNSFELEAEAKDLNIAQIPGFVGSPVATPLCPTVKFLERTAGDNATVEETHCPDSTAVGTVVANTTSSRFAGAVYNLAPPPGTAAKLGFVVGTVPVTIELGVNSKPPNNIIARLTNIPQPLPFQGSTVTLWGNPASPVHDPLRGFCAQTFPTPNGEVTSRGNCPSGAPEVPFLTLPRSCQGPLKTTYAADSWPEPGARLPDGEPDLSDPRWATGFSETHDASIPPIPLGMTGCAKLHFSPSITAKPTTKAAESPTGLDFSLDVNDEGLTNASEEATAQSDIRKAVVTLPQGFTVNPSIAEGLEVCSEADLARETAFNEAGSGCPNASKIGTVEVETPLLEENVNGALYQAAPYQNPFNSLIALYIVIKNPTLGIIVKQPLNVIPNAVTGQLTTVAEELPQLPFSHFKPVAPITPKPN